MASRGDSLLPVTPLSCSLLRGRPRESLPLLLLVRLEQRVDHVGRQQDGRPLLQRPHEIGQDCQRADAHAAESGGGRDVAVQLAAQGLLVEAVALAGEALVGEVLGDLTGGGAGDLDPPGGGNKEMMCVRICKIL